MHSGLFDYLIQATLRDYIGWPHFEGARRRA
jgi:hypothetical protein